MSGRKIIVATILFLLAGGLAASKGLAAEPRPSAQAATATVAKSWPKVEVYTTVWCPYCRKATDFLRANGIPFTEYDIERDEAAARRLRLLNPRGGVPTAVIGSEKIIGFSREAYEWALGM